MVTRNLCFCVLLSLYWSPYCWRVKPFLLSPWSRSCPSHFQPVDASYFTYCGDRSFPPFSLRCEPRGKQSAPFQFPTSEGRAEPRATLTFRSLKMIRSANGCLEPVRFTRLSNHFQMQEGYATGGLWAARYLSRGVGRGGFKGAGDWVSEWMALGVFWQFECILLEFFHYKSTLWFFNKPSGSEVDK